MFKCPKCGAEGILIPEDKPKPFDLFALVASDFSGQNLSDDSPIKCGECGHIMDVKNARIKPAVQ